MKAIKFITRAVLTAIALGGLVLFLGTASVSSAALSLASVYLSVKGLDKLGTFKEA